MDSRDKWRDASRLRVKAAEARLQRLRDVIERRARLGLDTTEGWRLFRLTATSLSNMRHAETMLDALHQETRWRAAPDGPIAMNGAERVSFPAGEMIQARDPDVPDCYLIESGIA